ncbi:MAG TPA: DUF4194 domain-containing protein [Candidatus Mediterraneibacter colneyensis]|nr:DUF4194 domain-containing protein [Candidatus Mediterraneibacter colneyensis]
MSDFSFMNKMSEDDAYLFKRCIRKMLDATFIIADKDERLYDYISAESNQYDVNTYLAAIGYKVVVEDKLKVAMLQQSDDDMETVGIRRSSLYRFDAKEIRLLIVLWLLFLERMGYAEQVYVTVGDIIDKCKIYQITLSPAEFKNAYRIFKRFSLIDYGDDIATEDGKVRLYPSLQFCMDIGQLKQVMAEYIADDMTEDMEENEEMPESGDTDE